MEGIPEGIVLDEQNEKLIARIKECLAHPAADNFKENLERLANMGKNFGGFTRIGIDFAPLSFWFSVVKADGSNWISGGMIFHGANYGTSSGAPAYSVEITPSKEDHWTLHS